MEIPKYTQRHVTSFIGLIIYVNYGFLYTDFVYNEGFFQD